MSSALYFVFAYILSYFLNGINFFAHIPIFCRKNEWSKCNLSCRKRENNTLFYTFFILILFFKVMFFGIIFFFFFLQNGLSFFFKIIYVL